MCLCCTVSYGAVSSNMYHYTRVMSHLILDSPLSPGEHTTFRTLVTTQDFWKVTPQIISDWSPLKGPVDAFSSRPLRLCCWLDLVPSLFLMVSSRQFLSSAPSPTYPPLHPPPSFSTSLSVSTLPSFPPHSSQRDPSWMGCTGSRGTPTAPCWRTTA